MRRFILLFLLCLVMPQLHAADGMLRQASQHSVQATMDRLERAVLAKGFRVFSRIDHAAGAAGAGMTLRPTQLLIFGNPKGGTVLMQQAQSTGLDLPLKYLVWEDAEGDVWVAWNAPEYLAARHGLPADLPVLAKMGAGLAGMAEVAAAP